MDQICSDADLKTLYGIADTNIWKLLGELEKEKVDAGKIITDSEQKLQKELLDDCLGRAKCKRSTKQFVKYLKNQIEFFTVKKELYTTLIANIENGAYIEGESN